MTYSELHEKMQLNVPQVNNGWLSEVVIRVVDPFTSKIQIIKPSDLSIFVTADGNKNAQIISLGDLSGT